MSAEKNSRESKVERAKRNSRQLRGSITETLRSEMPAFTADDVQVLKFHGVYQQDDRDRRKLRTAGDSKRAWQFMVRVAIPAGILTAGQYLELDAIADEFAGGSLRLTTRQGLQFHGVIKRNLTQTIRLIDDRLMTTLGACGDVQRNVMACPAPAADGLRAQLQGLARALARQLRPGTRAYHEIWLGGERVAGGPTEEAFYGAAYLPRKFKVGVAAGDDNCIDVLSYDLGLVARLSAGSLLGFNMVVGGGMGLTHNRPETFATLARPLAFIEPQHAVEAVRAVAEIFRDHGNRGDRRQARLKYLLRDWGMERFRQEFEARVAFRPAPAHSLDGLRAHDHLGLQPHGRQKWFLGIHVQSGRIRDLDSGPLKSALQATVDELSPGVRITPQQNLLLTDLSREEAGRAQQILADHGVADAEALAPLRRFSMACPALPTCGLALGESERLLPGVLDELEEELSRLKIARAPLTVRMTGCPNGCARPYTADLAFVARSPHAYHIYVGGRREGDRLADLFAADVACRDFVVTLRPLLERWAREAEEGESLGDFYQRRLRPGHSPRLQISGRERPLVQLLPAEAS